MRSALVDRDAPAAAALGTGRGTALLRAAAANAGKLHLVDLTLRLVEDRSSTAPDGGAGYSPDAWSATVALSYRIPGWDRGLTKVETTFVFSPGDDGAGQPAQLVAGIGDDDGRTPLWLAGPVQVLAHGRTLVVARDPGAARYSRLARRAVVAVGKVLPAWRGRLVLEVPASEAELDRALGVSRNQYANIAAVTASVDGSTIPTSPVHVFVNPGVFGPLGPRGAQVVISHESTHVATRATFASMPTWLLEGFADYVALAHAGIPVGTAASQIIARIKKDGPPDHLPTAAELDPTAAGLGATYEEAWLANRFLARRYGEAKLVAFYDAVDAGKTATQAFATVLGTTESAFVRAWRADLRALSRGVAG